MFKVNESTLDRDIRLGAAVLLIIAASFALNGIWVAVAVAVALVMFLSGATGFCPLYAFLGINHNDRSRSEW